MKAKIADRGANIAWFSIHNQIPTVIDETAVLAIQFAIISSKNNRRFPISARIDRNSLYTSLCFVSYFDMNLFKTRKVYRESDHYWLTMLYIYMMYTYQQVNLTAIMKALNSHQNIQQEMLEY